MLQGLICFETGYASACPFWTAICKNFKFNIGTITTWYGFSYNQNKNLHFHNDLPPPVTSSTQKYLYHNVHCSINFIGSLEVPSYATKLGCVSKWIYYLAAVAIIGIPRDRMLSIWQLCRHWWHCKLTIYGATSHDKVVKLSIFCFEWYKAMTIWSLL